jgi:hypothetical protein
MTLAIAHGGWFKVAARSGDCVSELSGAKGVTAYSGTASATISGEASGINPGDTRTYTAAMNNPQGASYSWTISGDANPTPASGTGSSIAVRFNSVGTATINLSAQNACGTASVTNNNYAVTVSPACTPPGVSSHSPSGKAVTVTQGSISGSLNITASGSPTLSYQWYQNTTATTTGGTQVGTNSEVLAIPTGLTSSGSPYYFYCEVTSSCDGSKALSDVFTVTVNPNPEALPAGAGSFAGRTCFDVAQVNNSGDCGNLASRKNETLAAQGSRADFTNPLTRNQAYKFTPSGTVSNVRFYAVEAGAYTGQLVESLTGGNPGNSITSAVTCSIIYKDNLNSLASGKTNADALTVDIFVVYNDNATNTGTDKRLKLTATIKDCACCGAYTKSGSWLSFMCYNLGADPTLTTPEQIKNAPTAKTWGNLYQWGKRRPWPATGSVTGWTTTANGDADAPGPNSNANAWGAAGLKGVADPCPPGWRVPSRAQWISITDGSLSGSLAAVKTNKWTWVQGAPTNGSQVGSALFLPTAPLRNGAGGVHNTVQNNYWWRDDAAPWHFEVHDGYFNQDGFEQKSDGMAVRCVAE